MGKLTRKQKIIAGVYKIINTKTGNWYVGSSGDILNKRFPIHKSSLVLKTHHCKPLQLEYNNHKPSDFKYEILHRSAGVREAETIEQSYLDDHWGKPYCFNICKSVNKSRHGLKNSPEHRKNISEGLQGKHPNLGKRPSDESIENNRQLQLGVPKPTSGKRKTYTVKSPDGELVTFTGLRPFCRKHGFTMTFHNLITGKLKKYKGWTLP
jgi:group I intron endonuclease